MKQLLFLSTFFFATASATLPSKVILSRAGNGLPENITTLSEHGGAISFTPTTVDSKRSFKVLISGVMPFKTEYRVTIGIGKTKTGHWFSTIARLDKNGIANDKVKIVHEKVDPKGERLRVVIRPKKNHHAIILKHQQDDGHFIELGRLNDTTRSGPQKYGVALSNGKNPVTYEKIRVKRFSGKSTTQ